MRIFVKFIVLQGFKLTNEKSGILGGGGTILCGNRDAFAQYSILVCMKKRALCNHGKEYYIGIGSC